MISGSSRRLIESGSAPRKVVGGQLDQASCPVKAG